jgi:replicative DNA helicase
VQIGQPTNPGFDRIPPHDLDAERGVLGSVLLMNDVLDEVTDLITADSFFLEANQLIYAAILRIFGQSRKVDVVTLSEELERAGELETVGGDKYLMDVLDSVPHAAHAKYYAQIVKEKHGLRNLIYLGTDLIREGHEAGDDYESMLARAESKFQAIRDGQSSTGPADISSVIMESFAAMESGIAPCVASGFYDLDRMTGGLPKSSLIILAARPSMGKTSLAGNVLLNAAKAGVPCVFFSLEQTAPEIANRLMAHIGTINSRRIFSGEMDGDERTRLMDASAQLSQMPLLIDDAGSLKVSRMAATCRQLKRRGKLGLVVVDYLQLIEPADSKSPREQQVAKITKDLKLLAKDLEVPVLALAQLNRGGETRPDKTPRMGDLRESGAIEQDADAIWFLHRPCLYDSDENPEAAELIVAKMRNGPTGLVKLHWDGKTTTFRNQSHDEYMNQFADTETSGNYFSEEYRET